MIYQIPEFAGNSNMDRPFGTQGILSEFPELLGIAFLLQVFLEKDGSTLSGVTNPKQQD